MPMNCSRAARGALLCLMLACSCAGAGEFSINPTRLELGATARSGAIIVRNEGKQQLSFQLEAMEWAQDAEGKDQYLGARDLIYFPKILTVEPGQERVVRVGTKTPAMPAERTYRLFIEELPAANSEPQPPGVQVTFLIRFGAPIFIAPLKAQDGLEIERVALIDGELTISGRNTGNRHQVIQGIHLRGSDASGKQVYALTLADRYLLAGSVKAFQTAIAKDQCAKIAALEIEFKTDKLSARRTLEVTRAMCGLD